MMWICWCFVCDNSKTTEFLWTAEWNVWIHSRIRCWAYQACLWMWWAVSSSYSLCIFSLEIWSFIPLLTPCISCMLMIYFPVSHYPKYKLWYDKALYTCGTIQDVVVGWYGYVNDEGFSCHFVEMDDIWFVMVDLMVSLYGEVPQDFGGVVFFYWSWLVLVPGYWFLVKVVFAKEKFVDVLA